MIHGDYTKIMKNIKAYDELIEGAGDIILKKFRGKGKYNKYYPWVFIVSDEYQEIGEDVFKKILKIDSWQKLNPYEKESQEILSNMFLRTRFNNSELYMLAILIPRKSSDEMIESMIREGNENFLDLLKTRGLKIA